MTAMSGLLTTPALPTEDEAIDNFVQSPEDESEPRFPPLSLGGESTKVQKRVKNKLRKRRVNRRFDGGTGIVQEEI